MSDNEFDEADFFNQCIATDITAKSLDLSIDYDGFGKFIISKENNFSIQLCTLSEVNAFLNGYLERQAEVNND